MHFFEDHALHEKEYFSYGYLEHPFPAHMHRAFELIGVRDGKLTLHVDQKMYDLENDELAFIFPNQIHGFSSSGQIKLYIAIFSPEFIDEFYQKYKGYVPVNNIIKIPKGLDFDEMKCIYSKKSAIYALCGNLLSNTEMEAVYGYSNTTILHKVFSYISINYAERCNLKSAAETLRYEYTYLSKLFLKSTGMSFTTYLNYYRISQACTMLVRREIDIPISEIAYRCGYLNLRTFHRNFRKVMHCSPQDFITTSHSIKNAQQHIKA